MRKRRIGAVVIVATIIILLMALLAFTFPYIKRPIDGSLEVSWARPKGIRFNGMSQGDVIHLRYTCDNDIGIYLLDQDHAEEYRSPLYEKRPLPDPVYTGHEGDISIVVDSGGDKELLFWNESNRAAHRVQYSISTKMKLERNISVISGTSLLIISAIPAASAYLKYHLKKRRDMRKEDEKI